MAIYGSSKAALNRLTNGLAVELYGRAPEVYTLGVGIASLEAGDRLSPAVESALPAIVEAVAALVAQHSTGSATGIGVVSRA